MSQFAGILAKPADQRTAEEKEHLLGWWLGAFDGTYQSLAAELAKLEKEQADVKARGTTSHVMNERSEPRQRVVHLVEYSRYPRRDPGEDQRVAYTQDRSTTGLGLDLPERVKPGELLRITLRDIDGAIELDGLARVVWCERLSSGRARAGLAMLRESGERRMLRVHKAQHRDQARNHAPGAN